MNPGPRQLIQQLSPQQKKKLLRKAQKQPNIVIEAIEETRRFLKKSLYREIDPVNMALLDDHERQFKRWLNYKHCKSWTDEQSMFLFFVSKFPNPINVNEVKLFLCKR
jgi:hypothetical protein